MLNLARIGLGATVGLALSVACLADGKAEVGKAAPSFTLKDTEGKEHKLADYKGKVLVLEWINHECPVVNQYHKSKVIADTLKKFEGKDVVWVAVDSTNTCEKNAEKIKTWNKDMGLTYPTLLDASGTVGKSFGATNTPQIFVIDTTGKLVYSGAVDSDGGDRNYVVEAVNATLEGKPAPVATTKARGCSVKYKP